MSSPVEFDELDKIIEVEDETISADLDEAVAAVTVVDEATVVEDDSSVRPGVTSKGKCKISGV
jgi:hypothetical protein